jgi:hypothetical protein
MASPLVIGRETVACPPVPGLPDAVRAHCASIAAAAGSVAIDLGAASYGDGVVGLDPVRHPLELPPEELARYVLVLDAVNFGSGWFAELGTDTDALTDRLTAHARSRGGPWRAAELRAMTAGQVAAVLGLPAGHELTALYARGLRDLGDWLADRSALAACGTSAVALAEALAQLPLLADRGFYKRAQITAADLHAAGVVAFDDVDALTVFADNLLPHVLRVDGVLRLSDALAARVDAGERLPAGSRVEVELRACAVHACEGLAARAGVPPRVLDNWLWNRGSAPRYADGPMRPHRTRTAFY